MDNYLDQLEQELQEKPINWREIFEKILMHWKWFVLSGVIALIAGAIYGRMQQDVYELKSSVLIIDQTRSGQMNEMSVLKQLDAAGMGGRSTSMINNEEQVIKSTVLMKKVVNRLELYTTYTSEKFLQTKELYTESPLYVRLDSAALAELKGTLVLKVTPGKNGLTVKGSFKKEQFEQEIAKLPAILKTPAGTVYMQVRPGKQFPEEEIIITISDPVKVAKSIAKGSLTTEVGKMIDVIDLTIKTSNVKKGQDILNTLAEVYNSDASEQNNMSAFNTVRFIDERLKYLTVELSEVEKNVEDYKQTNNLTDLDEDAKMFLTKTSLYDQQQIEVEMQQHLIKYIEDFVKQPSNRYALIPNLGLTDAGLVAIMQKYNELVMTRERLSHGSSDENPALITIEQQITIARNAILTGITNQRKGLQISGNDLMSQNSQMQSKIQSIPRKEREMLEIKRQQQVKEALYVFLLQKGEEAQMSMAIATNKARLLNEPDEAKKVAPRTLVVFTVFLLLGFIIPVSIIFFKNLLNTTIRNRVDIERITKLPVLLELSHNKSAEPVFDHRSNDIANAELFRLLRAKLQFVLSGNNDKVILVTSTQPGEGKTFVSVNLAITLSLLDKKVVLVGLDLRKPMLSKVLNLSSKEGVTSYLAGQVNDYHQLVEKPEQYPNLHVLPAGIIPPNPNELIISDRFDTLFSRLRDEYDYIVLDTSPVGAVSDTYLIDRVADMCLFVCRSEYSDTRNIEFVNRLDAEGSLRRIYLVVNDVDFESHKYAYYRRYGYGYGYAYGYTYGHSSANKKK